MAETGDGGGGDGDGFTACVAGEREQPQNVDWLVPSPARALPARIVFPIRASSCQDPPGLTGHEQAVVVLEGAGQPPGEQHESHDPLLQEQRLPAHASP